MKLSCTVNLTELTDCQKDCCQELVQKNAKIPKNWLIQMVGKDCPTALAQKFEFYVEVYYA